MSGLISGLDTDSIIKELMSAKSYKKTKLEQQKTKLEWKQEKWADLNTKLYKLYTEQLSKIRLAGNYSTKAATSSNESLVKATATSSAGSGSHTIEVQELASAQYITGGKVNLKNSDSLVSKGIMDAGTVIRITSGIGSSQTVTNLEITTDTKVADLVSAMKSAGLNANFDESQGRFFVSGKNSGETNAFSIQTYTMDTSKSEGLQTAAGALKTAAGLTDAQLSSYRSLLDDLAKKQAVYDDESTTDKVTAWTQLQTAKKKVSDMEETFYKQAASKNVVAKRLDDLKNANASSDEELKNAYEAIETSVQKGYYKLDDAGNVEKPLNFTQSVLDSAKAAIMQQATATINDGMNSGSDEYKYETAEERDNAIKAEYDRLCAGNEEAALANKAQEMYDKSLASALESSANGYVSSTQGSQALSDEVTRLKSITTGSESISETAIKYKDALESYTESLSGSDTLVTGKLSGLGLADLSIVSGKIKVEHAAGADTTDVTSDDFIIKEAGDATVVVDGAMLTSSGNSITAAGVTYSLIGAQAGTTINVSVSNDTKAVYDMVKNFVKSYNSILEEMNTLYNAASAKGYEPLTDDEKEAMSDKQIELWEDKIKDSLLRRDDTLGSVINTLRTSLQGSVTVNGKNYSLASLGVVTGDYTEKGLLHIQGNSEDSAYSANTNKLEAALSEDPEAVASVLSGIFNKLYGAMQDKMKGSSVSSALTFYNDKEMKKQITQYTKDISSWEVRLQDMEDRYYKQYSAMETALAKLQSSSNSLASMLGTKS